MTLLKAIMFTLIVPCSVAIFIPLFVLKPETNFHFQGDTLFGWLLIVAGAIGYISTALSFLIRGKGTPAIWFSKSLKFLVGEEPSKAVTSGLYRFSRNPMYLSVFVFTAGIGFIHEDYFVLLYAAFVFLLFHLAVVFIEEPHLKKKFGESYSEYVNKTRRWL
jgi:protein-S-isoprenylcysteine O-methyltransferase Ste14